MTNRYYIKTIEDIKYCEENNLVIRDADCKSNSYAFEGNCWVYYLEGQPALYNASIRLGSKLYYEEYQNLQKKLDIATKVLEDLELANDIRICMKAQEALTKMKGVK